jgi:signal transduction histidine kinase/CheY-like chemotaxis protein
VTWQFTWFLVPLGLSAGTCAALAVAIWRRGTAPGARPLALTQVAIAVWAIAYLLETGRADLDAKLGLEWLTYIGVCAVPAGWLAFSLEYGGYVRRGRWAVALVIEPLLVQLALATNDHHRLFFEGARLASVDGIRVLVPDFGPAFWAHAAYSWVLMLVGTVLLVRHLLRSQALKGWQVAVALAAIALPLVGNVLFVFGHSPLPHFDLGVLSFTATSAALSFALFRLRFLYREPRPRELVIEGMESGVLVLDGHLRLAQTNPAARRILRLGDRSDITGRTLAAALPELADRLPHLVRDPRASATTEVVLGAEDDMRVYALRASPLTDDRGTTGHLLVLHDITQAKHEQQVLRAVTDAARAGSRAKTEFLARMSHELRTPLNAIIGYAQLLASDGSLPDRHRRPIRIVEESGSHLLALINDILDLSKIEAGADDFVPDDFDLGALIGSLDAMFQLRCRQKGLQWSVEAARQWHRVHGDEAKVRQVLINLLGNAVKFTPSGKVTLRRIDLDGGRTRFEVHDTGPGIAAEQRQQIFEPFRQAAAGLREGGSGLGLAIARRHAELMGGRLDVDSEPGVGSAFTFEVPLPPARGEARAREDRFHVGRLPEGRRLRACVVDDIDTNRDVLTRMLRRAGVEVQVFVEGGEALAQVRQDPVDVVFTDLRMPGMSGYELRERLADLQADGRTKVVAVSASVMDEQRQTCLDAGFDDFLAKPLRMPRLQACLESLLGIALDYAEERADPAEVEAEPLRPGDIPVDVHSRLLAALHAHSVSDLRVELDGLHARGAGGRRAAEALQPLLLRFDLAGMRRLLDEAGV